MDNKNTIPQNYPPTIEEKLGFDKIREYIQLSCSTNAAKSQLKEGAFYTSIKPIQESISKISELGKLNESGNYFQFPEDTDLVMDLISRTDIEGIMLFEDELFTIYIALQCLEHNFKLIQRERDTLKHIYTLYDGTESLELAVNAIAGILDKEGKIRMDASVALFDIHKRISLKEKEVRRILHARFETAKKNGWAGDTEITIRNERLVIPIIAEFKKKMPGFVHDDSQSGKFLYIEPIECFEENNALKELYLDKKKECEKILREITVYLSGFKQGIRKQVQLCVQLDILSAKSIFSNKIKASQPLYVEKHDDCDLIDARHPLLFILMGKNNKQPVALNFHFKKGNYMVVVSGPNAGGKSIALKTIGLLQYMYQSGLPIPAAPDSKLSIYRNIFIDIGDNQSIENNLSSYSSHLMSMKYFMDESDNNTLYLIDELGNGTDPAIGSTIAQAILELLLSKKAIGIVTTHFGNLKSWASATEGVQNARMLYDLSKLEPLFILEPDKAGSSFALEVASKVGIDKGILQRARNISKNKQEIDLDELLAENEKNKKELIETQKRTESRERVLEKLISDYEALKESLSENKVQILNEAKNKANTIISDANKKIEQTIKEIVEHKAEKTKTKKIREDLHIFKENIKTEKQINLPILENKAHPKLKQTELKVGSTVRHDNYKVSGEILKIKKQEAEVLFGQMRLWLPLTDIHSALADKKHIPKTATFNVDQFNKQSNFRSEIDLRGVRGEAAIEKLDIWLHDAHLLGVFTLRIIHGRGYGILRKLIIEHLKTIKFVNGYEHESEQLGGDGVTIVKIN